MSDGQLELGFVAGVYGLRGGIRVQMHHPASEAMRAGLEITLTRARTGGAPQQMGRHAVRECSLIPGKPGRYRVTLDGVEDRDGAEELKGCTVWVDREALPALEDDEFYLADAIGLSVRRVRPDGGQQELGTIIGIMNNGAQNLFEVELTGRGRPIQWLLPILPGFVLEMDSERVLAEVPPGMLPDELEP